ncbi:unnamed protein product (macronuclear) [Paramecium tetraurelia]|uniref:G domain-containing protein n=1 Tax=Paramecium tetraurelia TaxID=5888 RepID=A0DRZ4_PARTE|nr:uncharacterized protein GSPATT00019515001 [Paramecium tetraurelia]CAK85811.1 unnamed protein product [Paramecium tetraurelia]|eukprot:XP_001453208.1 hypothetical protein (macronuclear) [Paramecium tetraurelia strain d4-2]
MQKLIENEFDVDCAYQHRLPICAILQDPNLNIKDRLLCQQCILDIDKEKTILGWRKVQDNVQSHIMEKQRINSQLISPLLPLVKQVKSNIEFLKDSIMKEFRMIEETLEEWQLELSKEIKLLDGKQFISELEYIFGNQLTKISLDEILKRDLNQLNSITISKVQSKLNFFKEFEQYKICSNILNSIEEENFSLQINQSIDEKSNELDNQKNILSDSTQISHINSYTTQQSQIFQQEQSPQSKQINQDNMCNVQQLNQQQNVEQIQLKEGLSLPLIKLVTTKDGDPQYQYYGQQLNNSIQYRNILFIGQRDEGKTTLLNAFVNYYFGIAWDDTFRLIVADQEQTTEISHYYIEPFNQRNYGVHLIDTPGNYGQDDNYTINKVSNFLYDNQNTIDIIIVCIKAYNVRLTVEAQQILQSLVQIIGEQLANKIIVARTFYSGEDVDQSILTSEQSPFYNLQTSLCSDYNLEFNSMSIIKITKNKSAKVYYNISIENLKKIENKLSIDFSSFNNQKNQNPTFFPLNNQVSLFDCQSETLFQDLQIQKGDCDRQYQQVYQDSYRQLRTLFMQCLRAGAYKQSSYKLSRVDKKSQYYQLNCNQCNITCFSGFKDEKAAEDFFSKELNGKSYCEHSKPTITIENKQITYLEDRSQQMHPNTYRNSALLVFRLLIKLFQLKENNNEQMNEIQFIEILKNEEQQDYRILEKFSAEQFSPPNNNKFLNPQQQKSALPTQFNNQPQNQKKTTRT